MRRERGLARPPPVVGCNCRFASPKCRLAFRERRFPLGKRCMSAAPVFAFGRRTGAVSAFVFGLSPPLGRTERDKTVSVFVPSRFQSAGRVGMSRGCLVGRLRLVFVGEGDHRFGIGREAGRCEPRHRRRATAEESHMAQRVALKRD